MKLHRARLVLAVAFGSIAAIGVTPGVTQAAPVPPPSFSDTLVTGGLNGPTDLAFTPDGRLLITNISGHIFIYKNGLLPPALDISASTCFDSERGMLGIAVDPSFATNHHIYVYYTYKKLGSCETYNADKPVNRVSRFTLGDNDTVNPASEVVLIDNIPSYTGSHNAGDVDFGKDGYLYVTVGDGFCDYVDSGCGLGNDAARDTAALTGKVLRITKDGGIPPTNPLQGPNDVRCNVTGRTTVPQQCREIYAWGLRNPFRLAFDPNAAGTRFHINDVGQDLWEEVNLGQVALNYGYNIREGHCWQGSSTDCGPPPPEFGLTDPIYDYGHGGGCTAITAGAFVPVGIWPEEYDDAYLFTDLVCGKLFRLVPGAGGTFTSAEVMTGINFPISATFGPSGSTQALYYISWSPDQIRRLAFTGQANRPPAANAAATPTYGSVPLTVNFDAIASSDPDNDPLTYEWDFGDGSTHANGVTVSHTYTTAGTRNATLTVRDDRNGQDSDSVQIQAGNNPPVPVIEAPSPTKTFRVGEQITLEGDASDPQDGALPDSALTFEVIKRHNTHFHPFFPATQGNNFQITTPPPEDLASTGNSHLEIMLTATDSQGLSSTVTQNLNPRLVNVTFQTEPSGLQLMVAGNSITAPRTIVSWDAWNLAVNAPAQSTASNLPHEFDNWSDGGSAAHVIATPGSPATYVASFRPAGYPRPTSATPVDIKLVPAHRGCTTQDADSTHGPPLTEPSCNPPEQESNTLMVGTPDKNGFTANETGRAAFKVFCTDGAAVPCSTAGDTEDISINVSITDVRCYATNTACPGGFGSDYVGRLLAAPVIRITDRLTGAFGNAAGTTSDVPFDIPIDCAATSGTPIGSSCSLTTTADALYPAVSREQSRAVWQLGAFEVYDAGPNGTGYGANCPPSCGDGDEQAFLRQGLFIP